MRGGVAILLAALVALAAAVQAAADSPADATTTVATTTAATTTTPTTTTAPATTTTSATTTEPAPTTTAPTTTTAPVRRPTSVTHYAAAAATTLGHSCTSSGAAAIVVPGGSSLAVGAAPAQLGAVAYRAIVRFAGASAAGSACRPGGVAIRSLSVFDGAVTADSIAADGGRGTIAGLRVRGLSQSLPPGSSLAIDTWGEVQTGATIDGTLTAPLAVKLLESHAGLPAGSVVLIGYEGKAAPGAVAKARGKHRHRHRHKRSHPLKVTPPLGLTGYVFPVSGGAVWGDTYGAHRSDVPGGWHHGDDLVAPLGTPVVAVADGTVSLIGWEKLGGWRLWVTDARGNEFYYAHLAGFTRRILHHHRVRAGQVLGFIGRTGDAFTTTPHLHFEVHPVSLLRLGEDGAVDPTTYLHGWHVVRARHVPLPALPGRAPAGLPRQESRVVWRELLAARGLDRPRRAPTAPPSLRRILPDGGGTLLAATPVVTRRPRPGSSPWPLLVAVGLGLCAVGGGGAVWWRRRARSPEQGEDVREPADDSGSADVMDGEGAAVLAADADGAVPDLPVAPAAGRVE